MSVLSMLKVDTWTSDGVVSWLKGQYNHVDNVQKYTQRFRTVLS